MLNNKDSFEHEMRRSMVRFLVVLLIGLLIFVFVFITHFFGAVYNLNTISKEELILFGIPEQVADDILLYRDKKPFESVEELKNIRSVEPFYNLLEKNLYIVTDKDYRLRQGDSLFVFGKETDVLPDGSCVLYDIVLNVDGLTINQVKEKYYRLTGRELDVVIRKSTGWIYVVGEKGVVKPGNYKAASLLELISLAEVDNSRFSGKILVYRNGRVYRYDFNTLMLERDDPRLYPVDRVYFKKRVFWKVIDTFEPVMGILRDVSIVYGIYYAIGGIKKLDVQDR
jgi:hypothetical protein